MKKILIAGLSLIVVLIIGVVVAISFIDVNQYKGEVIQLVKDKTGRNFEVGGEFEMALSLFPTVVVEDVKIGNAAWGSNPDMLNVGRFEVEVALLPLLSKSIQVNRVLLDSPEILLETNKQGQGNWVMGAPKTEEKPAEQASDSSVPAFNVSEVQITNAKLTYKDGVTGEITQLSIENLTVETDSLSDPMDIALKAVYKEIPVSFDGTIGSLANYSDNDDFPVKFSASVGDMTLNADGEIGKPKDLKDLDVTLSLEAASLATVAKLTGKKLPEGGPLKINGHFIEDKDIYTIDGLNAEFGTIKASVGGTIKDPKQARGFDLNIALDADSLESIGKLAEQQLPVIGPVKITSHVSEAEGLYTVKGLKADLGNIKIGADGTLGDPTQVKGFDLAIKLDLQNLADLNKLSGGNLPSLGPVALSTQVKDKEGAYQLSQLIAKAGNTDLAGDATINLGGKRPALAATLNSRLIDLVPFTDEKKAEQKKPKKDKVFSSDPLPFDSLKTADANLNINATRIKTADLVLDNVKLALKLNNGNLKISPLNTNVAGGTLSMQMNLDASSGKSGILDTKIDIKGLQPSQLPDYKDKFTGAKTDVDIDLKGAGKSVATIMAGSSGTILAKMGAGTFKSSSTDAASSDLFSSVKNSVSGKSASSGVTEINCGVVNLNVKDGIATADKGIAVSTKKMNIIGSGIIDFKTEKLDINIDPQAREGVGISAGQLAELVSIGGTLANPKAVPNTKAALKTAVSAGAAVATGGLSILAQGLFDKQTADENPCDTALGIKPKKKATTTTAAEKSTTAEEEKPVTTKAVDTVKDAGSAIKDTFKGLFD